MPNIITPSTTMDCTVVLCCVVCLDNDNISNATCNLSNVLLDCNTRYFNDDVVGIADAIL